MRSMASLFSGDMLDDITNKGQPFQIEWGTVTLDANMTSGTIQLQNNYTVNPAIVTGLENDTMKTAVSIEILSPNSFRITGDHANTRVSWIAIGGIS